MSILTMLKWSLMVLILFTSVASAQSVQTIDSETQLASVLCRNPKEDPSNELLLDKHAQLVNVTLWNALLDCASSTQGQRSPAKSVEIYKLTLRIANRLDKPELMATSYYYLGRTYSRMSDLENSIEVFEISRKLFEDAGLERSAIHVVADLGAVYFAAEDYENAQRYSEQSLAIAEQTKSTSNKEALGRIEYAQARALHTLGEIDLHLSNHADALKKLREALGIYERLNNSGSSYNIEMADVLIASAKVYGEMGRFGEAFSYLSKAHQVSRTLEDVETYAKIMEMTGFLFLEEGVYAEAESYLNESLRLYKSLRDTREEARAVLNLAVLEQRQGRLDHALELFQRTLDAARAAKLMDIQIAAGAGLGTVLTTQGHFPNALKLINESLEIARRVNAKCREVELLWALSQTYYAMQDYPASAALAEQALMLARTRELPKFIYLSTVALGEAYAAENKVELAMTTLIDAINQVEKLRDHTGGLESWLLFFENKLEPYHILIELLTRQGKTFEALLYAERAKGRFLLEAVRRNAGDLQNMLTADEKAELERLHNNVLAVYQRMQSASGQDPTGELRKQLDAAKREFTAFEKRLLAVYPELVLRAGPAQPLTEESLNRLVRDDGVAYLQYVVAGNSIGIFILRHSTVDSSHELRYVKLRINADELRQKVMDFHSALAERSPEYEPLGRGLYRLLIEPAAKELQNIKTICIIPDEFLWTLPFQALITTRGNYFIQDYALYYAPSFGVLKEMTLRRKQQSSKESLIAFANPVIETTEELKQDLHPIPEAETEVAAVAAAMRTPMKRVLVGRQADEKTFRALAPQYATIHLATHGVLDNRDPLNSYVVLTKTEGDWKNDGLLQAREIIEMHLDADLAVLSACETGNGRVSPGEGVIGMAWAFLVAGARSVVVSQWRVNSTSTSQLMKNFYEALARQRGLNAPDKSRALREASLRLLTDRRYRHPFYWAAFVLVSSN